MQRLYGRILITTKLVELRVTLPIHSIGLVETGSIVAHCCPAAQYRYEPSTYLSLGYVNDVSDVASMQDWVQLILPFDG
jgi:hypothetical protein